MTKDVKERGLIILVPEAEDFLRSFRKNYDSLADVEVPAHITINMPFSPSKKLDSRLEEILTDLFFGFAAFKFSLTAVRRFPEALYLTPEPEEPFKNIITAVAKRFPESPPYEGRFEDIIPHLTVAHLEDTEEIDAISGVLITAAAEALPIHGVVRSVVLIAKVDGKWREQTRFQLKE